MTRRSLTQGNLFASLLAFALPLMLANILQAIYGATDLVVVGQFADSASVSAVATGSQIMQTVTGIISSLSIGVTILVGQFLGAKNSRAAAKSVGTSIVLFSILALILTGIMVLSARELVLLMRVPAEAYPQTVSYVLTCSFGIIFIIGYNVVSGILRGMGDSCLPLLFVAIAAFVNIFGDLLLVTVFHMAATGAAIATVASQAISLILSIVILRRGNFPFELHRSDISLDPHMAWNFLRLGSPIALQDAMTSVSFLIIMAIINKRGLIASAAAGVVDKIVVFAMLPPMSFMSTIAAFTAQNIGAKRPERAKKSMYYCMFLSLAFGLAVCVVAQFSGATLTRLFTIDSAVVAAGASYFKAYSIDCVLVATFLVRIPLSWLISKRADVTMYDIGLAAPIASVVQIVLCLIYIKHGTWRNTQVE